ncbi:MAG: DUF1573 domain-containing protein [Cytophagales bacterium]|nr:DUF1573 domain-containing protein [Bernardetiaceae bacterium]MDW8211151.1 DUF1573 domain-containing protein [Cytophagales bacterium]
MKQLLRICLVALVSACANQEQKQSAVEQPAAVNASLDTIKTDSTTAPKVAEENYAQFKFETQEYNFGKIQQGKKVRYTYKFTNVGKVPLVISHVQPQCGCTAASYTKDPVPPGGQGEITLEFDSQGREGQQNKITTVYANVPGGNVLLTMTGLVEVLPDGRPVRKN